MSELDDLLAAHLAAPFPDGVEMGCDYGRVEPVMIDADIYGWALCVARRVPLPAEAVGRFQRAAAELRASLPEFPEEAHSYYAALAKLAELALVELSASTDP